MFTGNSTTPHNRQTNKKLVKIIYNLLQMDQTAPFRKPVPHKALGLDDYKKIVKKPIDLNQIRRQNNQSKYKTIEEALDDIQLCWENCKLYNHATSDVYQQAVRLQKIFWKMVQQNFPDIYGPVQNRLKYAESNQPIPPVINSNKNNDNSIYQASQSEQVMKQQKQMVDESSYNKNNNEVEPEESRNSKMQDENNQSNNEQNKSHKSSIKQQVKQPIQVCLKQRPTLQQLQRLTSHMKKIEQKTIIQQVLQILFTHEKQNMVASPKGQMNFRMQNIHLSTFYRICKVVKLELDDMLEIIQ